MLTHFVAKSIPEKSTFLGIIFFGGDGIPKSDKIWFLLGSDVYLQKTALQMTSNLPANTRRIVDEYSTKNFCLSTNFLII